MSADPTSMLGDEQGRLAALRRYAILDTPPDGAFERVTALAARFFDVPIAVISLVDEDRIWFKSRRGLEAEEIERVPGLCASVILQYEPWIVTDAQVDPRTLANPLVVGELGLRFYAGVPLTTHDGYNIGTINVIDREPREVTAAEIETLHDLAAIVIDELELRLAARTELERLDQVRSDFVTTVSHELRTPLAAVYGAAKTLHQGEGSLDPLTREQLLAMLEDGSERLTAIVSQILVVRQLEIEQPRIASERFDPAALARDVVNEARAGDGVVAVELVENNPATVVEGDPRRLRQILAHLLENAVAHSPTGGRVELGIGHHGGDLRFWVADEGAGIPEQERERVFAKFYRLDPTNLTGGHGIGLGLYICRMLADRIGARVSIDEHHLGGARFVVDLPLTPIGKRTAAAAPDESIHE